MHRLVNSNRKKMPTHPTIFLLSKSKLIIVWSSTPPMQIRGFYVSIIFHPYQPLYFIVFLQGKSIHFDIARDINPVDAPPILFPEFSQERAAFDFENHGLLDFSSFGILEARHDFVQPNVNTTCTQRIIHLYSVYGGTAELQSPYL